ncbi:hypothetical protein D3C81_1367970 [compost metagenome]
MLRHSQPVSRLYNPIFIVGPSRKPFNKLQFLFQLSFIRLPQADKLLQLLFLFFNSRFKLPFPYFCRIILPTLISRLALLARFLALCISELNIFQGQRQLILRVEEVLFHLNLVFAFVLYF